MTISADQLKSIVERIERLEQEKSNIAADISQVYSEAKGNGFDAKAIRTIVKLRAKDAAEREEEEHFLPNHTIYLLNLH